MFKINYKEKFYEIDSYIEVGTLKFLIYLKECNQIITSDDMTKDDFKKFLKVKDFLYPSYEADTLEKLYEYKNLRYNELTFSELLNLYRNIKFSSKNSKEFKNILKENMKDRLFQYENEGKDVGIYGLKALVRKSMITYSQKCDKEISNLIDEYLIFLKIKAYEHMNLYELLSEKDRFLKIIRSNDEKLNKGFPDVSIEILKNRLFPALKTLIKIKEDIYMMELFNLYRDILRQNPYIVDIKTYADNKNREFFYVENIKSIFEYRFYEKLGINLEFFEEDLESLHPCQYEYMSEYLYSLGYFVISRIKYTSNFVKKIYLVKKKYGHLKFIKYFLEYLEKIIRIT